MIDLRQGDCLELMKTVPDKTVDMVLCDLPYGVTNKNKNKWDSIIPFEELWREYHRICKKNAAIILFGQDKFTAQLMMSNLKEHRYNLIWDKVLPSGFLNANRMPLRSHEDLCVFYQSPPVYNPQKIAGAKNHSKGSMQKNTNHNYGEFKAQESDQSGLKHPTSILRFPKPHPSTAVHPTQKPVELLEYLIRTYTDPFSTVLDNCMGSGSTGVAAISQNRHFIGFELDKEYFEIAKARVEKAKEELGITAL